MHLKAIHGYFIGGELRRLETFPDRLISLATNEAPALSSANGDYVLGQIYVQHYQPCAPRYESPLLLWHGGGLTGACWENPPGGGQGWLSDLLCRNVEVIVSDAYERGRSGQPPYPQVLADPPLFRPLDDVWHSFRFGNAHDYPGAHDAALLRRKSHSGLQFPIEHLAEFGKQMVARWSTTDEQTFKAYQCLIEKTGPCMILAHSQGGYFALKAALQSRGINAVIALEPSGVPDEPPSTGRDIASHLFIWGDYIAGRDGPWARRRERAWNYAQKLTLLGVEVCWIDLPDIGISGNSHMLMMDSNRTLLLNLIMEWIDQHKQPIH
ncbi:alpha/beta fold hydrolase [Paracandidimonas soli]|uniref:Alpha/beta hydrolase family protein n=1 Tax=Paracandidimonas soli TaxID=1917182 RepID=A0A4R3VB38_9BURK|nr:alpha/beta fold hydrolase [Paracandidimonas soli]TCV00729.1 hypothetical protein EV686_103311 [Paracandidimonas soli]